MCADYCGRTSIQSAWEVASSRPAESNRAQAPWRLRPSTATGHDMIEVLLPVLSHAH